MKKISICCLKGGVGKTSLTFNLGGMLAEKHKVLFFDLDPQSNLSYMCGCQLNDETAHTAGEIFQRTGANPPEPESLLVKSPLPELPNIDLIPASIYLFKTEKMLVQKHNPDAILRRYFDKFSDFFSQYDYVLFDTSPSMGTINVNAFYLSDSLVIPIGVDMNSYKGAELFCFLWDEMRAELDKEDNVKAIVINNIPSTGTLCDELLAYASTQEFSRDLLLEAKISETIKVKESAVVRQPMNIYLPNHKVTAQLRALKEELEQKGVF